MLKKIWAKALEYSVSAQKVDRRKLVSTKQKALLGSLDQVVEQGSPQNSSGSDRQQQIGEELTCLGIEAQYLVLLPGRKET
ncbi:hypothetical protein H6F88_24140 [Oculatella sp. FACHB-28]|uniref:hypothetical protein n=1 Tax=Oculatella sp. FACHB-28 TaxID=2692845 RepID=UPI0019B5185C|nr:hypothetical protein [Oculatella sp. FACHB-28]MBD2059050.1 hypothetical protein [Oculatella sp. FACHB-28]